MTELKIQPDISEAPVSASIETFADLFCGIGGFHLAAHDLGLRCVFACDIDDSCREQYRENFGIDPAADITRVNAEDVPDHDILFAGFPCQPFSIIGDMNGLRDKRGTLFHEILRVLDTKRPRALVLENVRQFATIAQGKPLKEISRGLASLGYDCEWRILNALDFGLPQKRERIILVGFQDSDAIDRYQWPDISAKRAPLARILEKNPEKRYYVSARIKSKRWADHTPKVTPSVWHENKGGNISSHPYSCALRANASYNYLLVNGERRLTPREQLRLQGFPESFKNVCNDAQIRKQTGNAVPVPMVRAVIREVMSAASQDAGRSHET